MKIVLKKSEVVASLKEALGKTMNSINTTAMVVLMNESQKLKCFAYEKHDPPFLGNMDLTLFIQTGWFSSSDSDEEQIDKFDFGQNTNTERDFMSQIRYYKNSGLEIEIDHFS